MKRKNATTACQPCRKRRIKCDGRKPACSRCQQRLIQCAYSIEADGRRPASKSHVQLLRSRIELLERTLQAHSIDVDRSLEETLNARADSGPRPPHVESDVTLGLSGSLSKDASMNFDQDGEARYFGLASGRLEFMPNKRTGYPSNPSTYESQTRTDLSRLRINSFYQEIVNEKVIHEDLENELIDLYFKWEQPWVQVVDEKLFRDGRATQGKYFSPLLLNSILAIASRYCLRPEVRTEPTDPNTAGRLFLEKAEILLHWDIKSPNITTLQSLCILGVVYVAIGSDAAGWLHHGMASRLALDMGLNLDPPNVTPTGWLTHEEVELRKRVHWALYCIDKTASMYTGRVCTMLDSQAQVCLPDVLPSSETTDTDNHRRSTLGRIQRALIGVSRIIEKILLALYTPKSSLRRPQIGFFISSTVLELKNWYYDLPKELRLEHNSILQSEPTVYITHMVYHTAFILLMKPNLMKSQDAESRKISYQAASDICNVAKKYRKAFGSFRQSVVTATHCTLSAVLTLLNAAHHHWEELSVAINSRNIEFGLKVLEELSVSWNPAKRIRQNLQKLYLPLRKSTSREPVPSAVLPPDQHLPSNAPASDNTGEGDWRTDELPTTSSVSSDVSPPEANRLSSVITNSDDLDPQLFGTFENWPLDVFAIDESTVPDAEILGALHNFSYMETNPIFQFDAFPEDYSSFDILNRIHVQNM